MRQANGERQADRQRNKQAPASWTVTSRRFQHQKQEQFHHHHHHHLSHWNIVHQWATIIITTINSDIKAVFTRLQHNKLKVHSTFVATFSANYEHCLETHREKQNPKLLRVTITTRISWHQMPITSFMNSFRINYKKTTYANLPFAETLLFANLSTNAQWTVTKLTAWS